MGRKADSNQKIDRYAKGKNDRIDAHRIATYAFRYQDEAVTFERPRKVIEALKHLLATRQRLLKSKKQ